MLTGCNQEHTIEKEIDRLSGIIYSEGSLDTNGDLEKEHDMLLDYIELIYQKLCGNNAIPDKDLNRYHLRRYNVKNTANKYTYEVYVNDSRFISYYTDIGLSYLVRWVDDGKKIHVQKLQVMGMLSPQESLYMRKGDSEYLITVGTTFYTNISGMGISFFKKEGDLFVPMRIENIPQDDYFIKETEIGSIYDFIDDESWVKANENVVYIMPKECEKIDIYDNGMLQMYDDGLKLTDGNRSIYITVDNDKPIILLKSN